MKVINTLIFRGLGSGVAVLLTLLVTRYLETRAAATFLLLFNVTTVAAVCFRWGLDDVIIRREAAAAASPTSSVTPHLMRLVHRRVAYWVVATAAATSIFGLASLQGVDGHVPELLTAVAISGLIALTASAGRVHQGQGRTNYAAFILNILVPGLLLIGLLLLVWFGIGVDSSHLQNLYAGVAISAYFGVVWSSRLTRPLPLRWTGAHERMPEQAARDRKAANRLGGVVLSQQALNWTALLIIPISYGDRMFVSFMVAYKVALIISLVMFAVNFTFASQLAAYFAARDAPRLHRTVRIMVITVAVASGLAAGVIFLARGFIFSVAAVDSSDHVLGLLALSQAFFALSSVYALVLTMCHDESFLLKAQGAIVFSGVFVFVALSFTAPLEVASAVFAATYLTLALVLRRRVRQVIAN